MIESLSLSSSTIYLRPSKCRVGGWGGLKDKKCEVCGSPRKLSASQRKIVYNSVTGVDPGQKCFDFTLVGPDKAPNSRGISFAANKIGYI